MDIPYILKQALISSIADIAAARGGYVGDLRTYTRNRKLTTFDIISLLIGCYEMTLVKGEIACQKQIFEQGHVRRAETIRIPALATLLYVDWLPQVNGPPGALLSSVVDHESAIIVNT